MWFPSALPNKEITLACLLSFKTFWNSHLVTSFEIKTGRAQYFLINSIQKRLASHENGLTTVSSKGADSMNTKWTRRDSNSRLSKCSRCYLKNGFFSTNSGANINKKSSTHTKCRIIFDDKKSSSWVNRHSKIWAHQHLYKKTLCTGRGSRTLTIYHWVLSPACLPISPYLHLYSLRDSNSHAFTRRFLRPACLPIPTRERLNYPEIPDNSFVPAKGVEPFKSKIPVLQTGLPHQLQRTGIKRKRWDSNPWHLKGTPVFKTGTLNQALPLFLLRKWKDSNLRA